MRNRNKILADIVVANGGIVTDANNRNQLLRDWLDSITDAVSAIPYATNVNANSLSQIEQVGSVLAGAYTFNSDIGEDEQGTSFRWLRDEIPVESTNSTSYLLTDADIGSQISFEVTPRTSTSEGLPVTSSQTGVISAVYNFRPVMRAIPAVTLGTAYQSTVINLNVKMDVYLEAGTGTVYLTRLGTSDANMIRLLDLVGDNLRFSFAWTNVNFNVGDLRDGSVHSLEFRITETAQEVWVDGVLTDTAAVSLTGKKFTFDNMGSYPTGAVDSKEAFMFNVVIDDQDNTANSKDWRFDEGSLPIYDYVADADDANITNVEWDDLPVAPVEVLPEVSGLTVDVGDTATNDSVITITGTRFITDGGVAPTTATPILWDRTDTAQENNTLNTRGASYNEGDPVLRLDADATTLWEYPSVLNPVGEEPTTQVLVTRGARAPRYTGGHSHYYALGPNAYLGWPMAYGGRNTPAPDAASGSKQLYLSWWYKSKYSTTTYCTFYTSDMNGTFIAGDVCTLVGAIYPITATVIDFTGGKIQLTLASDTPEHARYYAAGGPAVGLTLQKTSGGDAASATMIAPYEGFGANKFIRVWDESDYLQPKRCITSWTNDTLKMDDELNPSKISNKIFTGDVGAWNRMEMQFDFEGEMLKVWVNGALENTMPLVPSPDLSPDHSETIALLGFNGKHQHLQESDFGDIYMDNKLNRVVIADSATWSGAESSGSAMETQYPTAFSSTSCTFKLYKGAYSSASGKYVYIFDETGKCNENGYLIP